MFGEAAALSFSCVSVTNVERECVQTYESHDDSGGQALCRGVC